MTEQNLTPSLLRPADAAYSAVVGAGDYWIHEIKAGQTFRIVDIKGQLFHFREVVTGVAVQHQLSHLYQREVLMRPHLTTYLKNFKYR